MAPSRMLILQVREWMQIWGEVLLCRTSSGWQNSRRKWSKKNGDKSAVAVLKISRQLGCVFQDMKLQKSSSILRKSFRHAPTNPTCEIHESRCPSRLTFETKILRSDMICPGDPHQRSPNAPKFEDRSQEETEWTWCPRSTVKAGQKRLQIKGARNSNIFLTFGKLVPACINSSTWGKRICCPIRCVDAHDQQKGLEWFLKWILWRIRAIVR